MNRYKNARECMLAIGANGNGYEQRIAELEAERDKALEAMRQYNKAIAEIQHNCCPRCVGALVKALEPEPSTTTALGKLR